MRWSWMVALVGCAQGLGAADYGLRDGAFIEGSPATRTVSGGLALTLESTGQTAVIDAVDDGLYLVSGPFLDKEDSVPLPAGAHPTRLAQRQGGPLWVTLRNVGQVAAFDVPTLDPLGVLAVCEEPRGVDVEPHGPLWVACGGGELVRVQPDGTQDRVFLRPGLHDVVAEPEQGVVWVNTFKGAELLLVDREEMTVLRTDRAAAAPDDDRGGVYQPRIGWRMIAAPDEGVYLAIQRSTTSVLEPVDPRTGAGAYQGARCDGLTHTVLVRSTVSDGPQTSLPLSEVSLPTDLTWWDDERLWVVSAGAPNRRTSVGAFGVRRLFGDSGSCVTSQEEVEGDGHVQTSLAFNVNGRPLTVAEDRFVVRLGSTVVHPGQAHEEEAPFRLFHQSTRHSALSCASCHPGGTEDGHTWFFSDLGARRTQDLSGGLLDTAPYHWEGELADLDDLMEEVFVGRMRGTGPSAAEVQALGEWMHELRPPAVASRASAALVAQGEELFGSARMGCMDCHSGPQYTNAQSADVGTGGTFQVPGLRGVARRVPLMHDGCAETLAMRFDPRCGGDAHGIDGEDAADDEIAAMVAFLETL